MDFKQLQSLVSIIESGSFTQTAEKLYLSQPTVSSHIQSLEKELGQKLLIRTTKSLTVTEKGRQVYDYAKRILELQQRMINDCKEHPKQILHLGASTIPSAYILPDILPRFGALHPQTYYVVHQSDSQGVIQGLYDGIFDIGLIGMKPDNDLVSIPICKDHMILITPVTEEFLSLAAQKESPLHALLQKPMILREKGSGSRKSSDAFLKQIGLTDDDLNIVARINDQETIKNMVASGLGVSLLSHLAAQNFIDEKRLLAFELPSPNERILYLAYRKDYVPNQQMKELISFISDREHALSKYV